VRQTVAVGGVETFGLSALGTVLPFLLEISAMARMKISRSGGTTRIRIAGRLTAADMGRLERACAAALIVQPLRLNVDLERVTEMDATAAAVLARLNARGAVINPPCGESGTTARSLSSRSLR
jgi:hypothetical protein